MVYRQLLLWSLLFGAGVASLADEALAARVRALPPCVGENTTVIRARNEGWVTLGVREHVGFEHLRRANPNGFFTRRRPIVIPGQHQTTPYAPTGLVVNLPELTVFRWQDGKAVAWYPISIGRVSGRWHTPVGQWQVIAKRKYPDWHRPEWAGGGVMPAGRGNPLGTRWIGLSAPGYGLHGTNDITSIGRTVSHGCMRMFPRHVEELFDTVWVHMPVTITYETITVGQRNGAVYLAVFPDVYGTGANTPAAARRRLATFGLAHVLTTEELSRLLRNADGVARPILGSTTPLLVNGTPLSMGLGVTVRNGKAFAPLRDLAAALNAQLTWNAPSNTTTLTRGNMTLTFTAGSAQCFEALDALFVPIRPLADQLGGTVVVSDEGIHLAINQPDTPTQKPEAPAVPVVPAGDAPDMPPGPDGG